MTELNAERARQAIVEHTQRMAESAAAAGPDAAVPTAPKWTVTDLVAHVGQTENWVAEIIERRITDPTQLPTEMAVLPSDPGEWPAWLSESAQRVANACSDDALGAPVLNPRETGDPGRDSGCPASSTRRSSTALTQPTRPAERPTLTPTSPPRSSATTSRCSPPPPGR
jgi:hypothetical protein